MVVHNLQSSFDTYVIHGGYRFGNSKLKQFRGYFSVVFHLLQMMGRLLHFYERHLHEAGYKNIYKQVHDRLTSLIIRRPYWIVPSTTHSIMYAITCPPAKNSPENPQ